MSGIKTPNWLLALIPLDEKRVLLPDRQGKVAADT
jgi:hypothetical protein